MTPVFTLTEAMWLAIISGVIGMATLVVKHLLDRNSRRIDETKADVDVMKALVVDLIQWASALETHITAGKPPPPPERPASVIEFFTTTFIERNKDSKD